MRVEKVKGNARCNEEGCLSYSELSEMDPKAARPMLSRSGHVMLTRFFGVADSNSSKAPIFSNIISVGASNTQYDFLIAHILKHNILSNTVF